MPRGIVDLNQGLRGYGDTQLLSQLPHGCAEINLAGIDMAGTRRAQQAWAIVLGIGTSLQAE